MSQWKQHLSSATFGSAHSLIILHICHITSHFKPSLIILSSRNRNDNVICILGLYHSDICQLIVLLNLIPKRFIFLNPVTLRVGITAMGVMCLCLSQEKYNSLKKHQSEGRFHFLLFVSECDILPHVQVVHFGAHSAFNVYKGNLAFQILHFIACSCV